MRKLLLLTVVSLGENLTPSVQEGSGSSRRNPLRSGDHRGFTRLGARGQSWTAHRRVRDHRWKGRGHCRPYRSSYRRARERVLVSSPVRDLVAGSGIVDRGAATLKGIGEEWRLYAVDDVA
jgi:hypothetical protein